MRKTFYNLLKEHAPFADLVKPELLFAEGAVPDAPQDFPFAVMRWGTETPELGESASHMFALWVYDDGGEYLRINAALKAAKDALAPADGTGMRTTSGGVLMGVHYLGRSPDLKDDDYHALARYASWRVVGTGE